MAVVCEKVYELPEMTCQLDKSIVHRSSGRPPTLSVVIPAFNEASRIRRNLEESIEVLRNIGVPFEIIAVDDGSSDDTKLEIELTAADHPEILCVSYEGNGGKGNALRAGCRSAVGHFVTFMDADLEIHPRQLLRFIEEMERTGADVDIGSKRHPESKVDYPLKRKFLSWGYNILIRSLFNLKLSDTQPGFKLFRREVLDKELPKLVVKKWAFDLELLVNADKDGFKIVEAPIELHFNREDGGRIGFGTVRNISQDTLGIFYRLRIIKYYEKQG